MYRVNGRAIAVVLCLRTIAPRLDDGTLPLPCQAWLNRRCGTKNLPGDLSGNQVAIEGVTHRCAVVVGEIERHCTDFGRGDSAAIPRRRQWRSAANSQQVAAATGAGNGAGNGVPNRTAGRVIDKHRDEHDAGLLRDGGPPSRFIGVPPQASQRRGGGGVDGKRLRFGAKCSRQHPYQRGHQGGFDHSIPA